VLRERKRLDEKKKKRDDFVELMNALVCVFTLRHDTMHLKKKK